MPELIVHIIDRMPPDGAERLIVEVLRYRSERYRYHLLCLAEGGPLVSDVENRGVPVTILGKRPGLDIKHAWRLWRWLRQHRPHAVHTHLFTADAWGRTCAWLAGVPGIFSTVHSTNIWKSRHHLLIDRCLAAISDQIVACSAVVEKTLLTQGMPRQKVQTIANGVDLHRMSTAMPVDLNAEFAVPAGIPVFALVGRLHQAKGHTDLLPILAELAVEHEFVVLFVGEGELQQELEQAVSENNLTRFVRFTGFRNDVIGILKSVDYLLMPSRWEGLPITLLESMACGTPALASCVGGIPDVIEDGVNGWLVESGNQAQLKARLKSLLDKQSDSAVELDKIRSAAQQSVAERFSAEAVSAAYDALYDQVS